MKIFDIQPGALDTSDLLIILLAEFPFSWTVFIRRNCLDVLTIIVSLWLQRWWDLDKVMIIGSQDIVKHTWPHNCSHSQTSETLSEARMSLGSFGCLRGLHKRRPAQATSQHSNGPSWPSHWACLKPFTIQIWATSMFEYVGWVES